VDTGKSLSQLNGTKRLNYIMLMVTCFRNSR